MFRLPIGVLLLLFLAAVAFVALSAAFLPPVVASHFAVGGAANGFMPRAGYLALMMALMVGVPLLLVGLASVVRVLPTESISLPNREYWLSPERREETLAFLESHGRFPGVLLLIFLCFVHALVLVANGRQPPLFPERPFLVGLVLFVAVLLGWVGALILHFRRP